MFSLGGWEMVVIGATALIVVGPKDLPKLFLQAGRFVGRMRGMADDFRRSMEDAAKDAGMDDVKKDLDSLSTDAQGFNSDIKEAAAGLNREAAQKTSMITKTTGDQKNSSVKTAKKPTTVAKKRR